MFVVILVILLAFVIVAASALLQRRDADRRLTMILLGAYGLRLALSHVAHTVNVFSTASGADSSGYETNGAVIARYWQYTGVHYVTHNEMPSLQQVSFPPNVFALVDYLNGEPTHFGCVAVVAAIASFICLDLYLLARQLGARADVALAATGLIAVLPSFLYYTADTYKDGFVALFVLGTFACSIRLARKFSPFVLGWATLLLCGLWATRFYLVFVMPVPLLIGWLGLRSGSLLRMALAGLLVAASIASLYAYSDVPETIAGGAVQTFQRGTSEIVLNANADSGSGVNLGTGPASFVPKLAYTVFSPFPWQPGSLGLQLEKAETLIWYYFLYRAYRAARRLWRESRADLVTFASFVVPITLAYAFSFANIGLIVRERIGIVLAVITLATVSWSTAEGRAPERAGRNEAGETGSSALSRGVVR